jgi:hypothetical protein
MEIVHRITLSESAEARTALARFGITILQQGSLGLTFEVRESHPHWGELGAITSAHWISDLVSTQFSSTELESAAWLKLDSTSYQGYPQPEDAWREASFDLTGYCPGCHTGARQVRPFIMKKSPPWGRNGILQLHWVYDEAFVKPDVWAAVFAPLGVGKRDVVDLKGRLLDGVVQLDAGAEAVSVDTSGLAFVSCARCGAQRHAPVKAGFFPALREQPPRGHFGRTAEYFGPARSGIAVRPLLISQALHRRLERVAVRGTRLVPLATARGNRDEV